jgi:hypothetical protein
MDKESNLTTSATDSYLIQARAAMLRLCLGFVLCGLAYEIHAAQPDVELFAPGLDLLSIKLAHYDAVQPVPYRYSASVVIADTASERLSFGGTSSLPDYINMEKVTAWVASIRWHMTADGNRASLAPHLRIESNETLLEIKPVDRSVWMVWHKTLD